jgi:hypothetical protein
MPRDGKDNEKREKTDADKNLNHSHDRNEPLKKSCSPNPISDYASGSRPARRSRGQDLDIWIIESVLVHQAPAGNEVPIDGDSSDDIYSGIKNRSA